MNKFEKLIEFIINDEDQKARELFHDIVVEKSRDIYESIMDEEHMEEKVHAADNVESLTHEVSDEEAHMEDEEGEEEFDLDADHNEMGDEMVGHDEESEEHEEIEDQVMNIDAKLDELLAKFDEIMGHEEHSDEMDTEPAEFDSAADMEEESMMEASEEEEEEEEEESKEPKGKKTESKQYKKSTSEIMREYVDQIGDIYGGPGDAEEGTKVGGGDSKRVAVNKKPGSVGPGADFGGESVDFKGAEQAPDGKPIEKPSNEYSKGEGKLIGNVGNTPGGDKKLKAEPAGHGAEKNGDSETGEKVGAAKDGKVSVNKKSEIGGRVR